MVKKKLKQSVKFNPAAHTFCVTSEGFDSSMMTVQVELISPDLATSYLKKNANNRKISPQTVELFAREMLAGNWYETHQGIAFDDEGFLLDGQHRLLAIVKSGVSVRMLVTRGLRKIANAGIDNNKPRSVADYLHYQGKPATARSISIARMLCVMKRWDTATKQEIMAAHDRHYNAIMGILALFPTITAKITIAAVMTPVVRATYHPNMDQDRIMRFCEVIVKGRGGEDEAGILKLRDYLLKLKTVSGGQLSLEIYRKTERALYNYCNDKGRGVRETDQELFPLPEEQETAPQVAPR